MPAWKDIPGYPGYQATRTGRIRSSERVVVTKTGKRRYLGFELKPGRASHGYLTVCLGRRRTVCVHYILAITFIGPPPFDGAEVRHKNDERQDNRIENLCWGSRSDNNRDKKWNRVPSNHKLTPEEVRQIKERFKEEKRGTGAQAARDFNVSQAVVSKIKLGKLHTDV